MQVYEETGYLLKNETAINPKKCIQKSMKGQQITLFIVPNVPMDYQFQTRTRKEIGVRDTLCCTPFMSDFSIAHRLDTTEQPSRLVERSWRHGRKVLLDHAIHQVHHLEVLKILTYTIH